MATKPQPGGYWDRQDLNEAIRVNGGLREALKALAAECPNHIRVQILIRDAALLLGDQQRALRDIESRWAEARRTKPLPALEDGDAD